MRYSILSSDTGWQWSVCDMAENWEIAMEKFRALRKENPTKTYHVVPS